MMWDILKRACWCNIIRSSWLCFSQCSCECWGGIIEIWKCFILLLELKTTPSSVVQWLPSPFEEFLEGTHWAREVPCNQRMSSQLLSTPAASPYSLMNGLYFEHHCWNGLKPPPKWCRLGRYCIAYGHSGNSTRAIWRRAPSSPNSSFLRDLEGSLPLSFHRSVFWHGGDELTFCWGNVIHYGLITRIPQAWRQSNTIRSWRIQKRTPDVLYVRNVVQLTLRLRVSRCGEAASRPCSGSERRPLAFLLSLNIWSVSAAMSADVAVCHRVLTD